jgi:molybdopterin-guanine dinucleotide biosynthesis protein B
MTSATPVVSVVGRSGSGKTTFLEKLIRALKGRGYRLAVIKHHHHAGLGFDAPGKDSYRLAAAGADQVLLAGPDQVVHLRRTSSEPSLDEVVAGIRDVDLIITEGWKGADSPKIEVIRVGAAENGSSEIRTATDLVAPIDKLVAIVSDTAYDLAVPRFGLEDVGAVADFVEARFLPGSRH